MRLLKRCAQKSGVEDAGRQGAKVIREDSPARGCIKEIAAAEPAHLPEGPRRRADSRREHGVAFRAAAAPFIHSLPQDDRKGGAIYSRVDFGQDKVRGAARADEFHKVEARQARKTQACDPGGQGKRCGSHLRQERRGRRVLIPLIGDAVLKSLIANAGQRDRAAARFNKSLDIWKN